MHSEANRAVTCCFTGHRPSKLPWRNNENDPRCLELKRKLFDIVDALYAAGIRKFICGMAPGCDMYFCEAVMELRKEYDNIIIEAAIPCETQSQNWDESLRARYFDLIHRCDTETLLQRQYTKDCMIKRNIYMVDNSSVLVAVFDGTLGGTMQTINYARKKGLEILELRP